MLCRRGLEDWVVLRAGVLGGGVVAQTYHIGGGKAEGGIDARIHYIGGGKAEGHAGWIYLPCAVGAVPVGCGLT